MTTPPLVRDVIDATQFEEMRELLDDDFVDLVQAYISDSQVRVETIRNALADNDNSKGFNAAHALKGASANLGTNRLTELCYKMQEACRDQTIDQQEDLLNKIQEELRLVQEEIKLRLGH